MSNEKKSKPGIMDIVLPVLTLIFLVGIKTFLQPCGPKDDGSWMTCHWAGQSIFGISIALFIMAILHLLVGIVFSKPGIKAGISIGMVPIAIIGALTPGHLIGLCMMETMRCHTVTRPATIVFCMIIAAVALINFFIQRASQDYEDKWGK